MCIGNWVPFKIDQPGNWFYGWTIPIFPRIVAQDPEVLSFESFRQILSGLNKDAKVDGEIEKHKAEELYYHFLIQYFPDCPQISVLKRRYSHPNVLDINFGAYYLIHEGRSRIWPPSSELRRRQVSSDEGGVSIHETGGTLESLQESTNKILSPDKNPRHVSSKESCQTIHRSTRESDNDSTTYQESTSDMSTYSGNIAPSYVEQKPEMEGKQAKSQSIANIQTKEARSKRKSSSDDTPNWPAYDTPQHSSKRIKSNSEDIPIKNEPLDEELLDRLQKLRNDTDTTMNETGSPLSDPSVQTACDIPGDNPFLTVKEKREEEVQIWLSLANAINKARSVLRGDDRELFEQLITVPATSTEAEKLIQRWKDGKLATFGRPGEMASKPFNWKERSEQATSPRERDSTYFSMEGYPGCF